MDAACKTSSINLLLTELACLTHGVGSLCLHSYLLALKALVRKDITPDHFQREEKRESFDSGVKTRSTPKQNKKQESFESAKVKFYKVRT